MPQLKTVFSVFVLMAVTGAQALTIAQSSTLMPRAGSRYEDVSSYAPGGWQKFDGSLGTLTKVTLSLNVVMRNKITFHNYDPDDIATIQGYLQNSVGASVYASSFEPGYDEEFRYTQLDTSASSSVEVNAVVNPNDEITVGFDSDTDYFDSGSSFIYQDSEGGVAFDFSSVTTDARALKLFSLNPLNFSDTLTASIYANQGFANPGGDPAFLTGNDYGLRLTGRSGLTATLTYEYEPVPEPASMVALGLGLGTILRRRRK